MRTTFCLMALLASGPHGRAADLTKIDRTIRHEPAYETKAPRYGLLAFGPAAGTKVWLVVDGKTLYVDEQGKGDLRHAKQVKLSTVAGTWFKAGSVRVTDRKTEYRSDGDWFYHPRENWLRIDLESSDGWEYSALPRLADHPRNAPVVHIGGPLTMRLGRHTPKPLKRGEKLKLGPFLGTRGLGQEAFAYLLKIPKIGSRRPQADVRFPPRRATDAPIRVRVKFKWDEC